MAGKCEKAVSPNSREHVGLRLVQIPYCCRSSVCEKILTNGLAASLPHCIVTKLLARWREDAGQVDG